MTDLESRLRRALDLTRRETLEAPFVYEAPADGIARGFVAERHEDLGRAAAAAQAIAAITQQPTFRKVDLGPVQAGVTIRRWQPDSRTLLVTSEAAPSATCGAVAEAPDLGWVLFPWRAQDEAPSALRLPTRHGDLVVANDDGRVLLMPLRVSQAHDLDLDALLGDCRPPSWLRALLDGHVAYELDWHDALAAGLVARFALAFDARGARAALERSLRGEPTPAKRVAAWAESQPDDWVEARERELAMECERALDTLESLGRLAAANADPAAVEHLALDVRVQRDELESVLCTLYATRRPRTAQDAVDAVDRDAIARMGLSAMEARPPSSPLLQAVWLSQPNAWWGEPER